MQPRHSPYAWDKVKKGKQDENITDEGMLTDELASAIYLFQPASAKSGAGATGSGLQPAKLLTKKSRGARKN